LGLGGAQAPPSPKVAPPLVIWILTLEDEV
jgi:hypothetical protein